MISFHEMELNFTPKPYKIILSRLIVNGREISVGDKTGILQHSLCHTGEITLNADQSMFSIEFATSNYIPANKDDIIYRLEGFSNEWTSTRGLHTITYTNLNAGTYTLLIKPEGKDENLCPASTAHHSCIAAVLQNNTCLLHIYYHNGSGSVVSDTRLQIKNQTNANL